MHKKIQRKYFPIAIRSGGENWKMSRCFDFLRKVPTTNEVFRWERIISLLELFEEELSIALIVQKWIFSILMRNWSTNEIVQCSSWNTLASVKLDFDERDSGLNCKKTGKEIVLQFCPFSVLEDYVSKLYFSKLQISWGEVFLSFCRHLPFKGGYISDVQDSGLAVINNSQNKLNPLQLA